MKDALPEEKAFAQKAEESLSLGSNAVFFFLNVVFMRWKNRN